MIRIDDIVEKVRTEQGWTLQQARRYSSDYLDFLTTSPRPDRQPTCEVDAIWHAHILHTRRYRSDCQALIGGFIDHEPMPALQDAASLPGGAGGLADCTAEEPPEGPIDGMRASEGPPPRPKPTPPRCTAPARCRLALG